MEIFSFKAAQGNFGDDLNDWLWPKLLGNALRSRQDTTLIGIGSVLDSRLKEINGSKLIFGCGIRSTRNLPQPSNVMRFKFVRGPISAIALGHDTKWITDPAILVRALAEKPLAPGKGIGLMPHYHTLPLIEWEQLAAALGFILSIRAQASRKHLRCSGNAKPSSLKRCMEQ